MGLMNIDRPLIGITPAYSYDEEKIYINNGYMESVNKTGGLAILLPLTDDESLLMDVIKRCDGFLVSGGPDIDAKYYNENNFAFNGTISPLRDAMDIYITKKAFEAKKPILGICRGIQVLNVAMGGTLYQDINSQIKGQNILKHSQNAPKWYPIHEIYIERDSIIWETFKTGITRVNSFHHQAVKDVAPGFVVTSKAADGVIESIEYVGQFAVGVQWHPEVMWKKDIAYLKIFEYFISAANAAKSD
jgi:putative glutamine amidotransferase